VRLVPIVGDVLDASRVRHVFDEHAPDVLFHAAAYKHVPLMELNPHEAVKVNILGTKNLCEAAIRHAVKRFVFISSDKAVHPSSVMGATKRVGELLLGDYTERAPRRTRFMSVRFGNVLESSGSVVPLFKEQIRRGGPVTVTHPQVRRYFMTTREAVHLVLNAAILGEGGEVFVLDMGEPIRMVDMARQLISLYGYTPDKDIEIVFTGLRPGEKLEEGLFHSWEEVRETRHPKIRVAGRTRAMSPLGAEDERLEAIVERAMSGATCKDMRGLLLDTISTS
jgi:FlaA1/EpsC-like NDP-sugar epimerase